jgi:hypothetical protein
MAVIRAHFWGYSVVYERSWTVFFILELIFVDVVFRKALESGAVKRIPHVPTRESCLLLAEFATAGHRCLSK